MAQIRKPRMINTSRILRGLWLSRRVSRIGLSRDLGLNKSTITNIVNELIEGGLVREASAGVAGPQGGRKPVHIELNPQYGYVLGLEIRPESYTAVAVDLAGDILFSRTERLDSHLENFQNNAVELLHKIPQELQWLSIPILGAGIGISGIVDTKQGTILGSIPLGITKMLPFTQAITSQFDFPIFIENDANCCAWGELAFHRTQKLKNFIFTLVEFHDNERKYFYENTSVGFGMVFNGNVYKGNRFSAGEFHSVFCHPEDKGQFRISNARERIEEVPEHLEALVEELCKHLALFVNTFNLGQIFLGGDIERHQNLVTPILLKAIEQNWAYDSPVECEIRFSTLGNKSVAYGAAGMVLEQLFADPDSATAAGIHAMGQRGTLLGFIDSEKKGSKELS